MKYLMMELSRLVGLVVCLAVLASLSGCKPTISFTALEAILTPEQSTELEWEVEFARGSGDNVVEISPSVGVVEQEGSITVTPGETTTYTLKTRSFVFGFPMFIKEELTVEVKDGRFWDFTDPLGGVTNWTFDKANYLKDDEVKYVFGSAIDQPVPGLGYSGVLFSVNHDEPSEVVNKVIVYGTAQETGLEDDTDYDVTISVVYAVSARRDVNDADECEMPTIELFAHVGVEKPEIEIKDDTNDDFVSVLNLNLGGTNTDKRQLSPDITIADATDDTCGDNGVFEEASESTGISPISIQTDSDGELWITIALVPSEPTMTVYLRSVTAIFEEQ